jgi:DNA-binding CsgD family transcriptional regulator
MTQAIVLVGPPASGPLVRIVPAAGPCLLGRSSRCDLTVDHPSVSRRHAELLVLGARRRVTDLRSRNGTFVDGERVRQAEVVAQGRQVRFGGVTFLVGVHEEGVGGVDSSLDTDRTPEPGAPPAVEPAVNRLSEAQQRVFNFLVSGMAEKGIAASLRISPHTVHNHVRAIYHAFAVHSRPELLARLMRERTRS